MPCRDGSRRSAVLLPLLLALGVCHAAAPLLDAFGDSLARLSPVQRQQLQARAARWEAWREDERQALRERAAAWAALSPGERAERRERHAAWHRLSPGEQAQVKAVAARWQRLDPAQQHAWRERYAALDESERRGWMLGPVLGVDYPRLQPLLAQVPPREQAPLLQVLRELTPAQRADLAVLVQRTPPQARARLRHELLSTTVEQRSAWLFRRLDR